MTDVTLSSILGGGGGSQRRATYVLTSSNASFPIPTWAQGGKGVVYVTGCGAGGSGGVVAFTSQSAGGGGGGGSCRALLMPIPAATTTLAATVGAAGSAVSGAATTVGNAGGNTSVSFAGQEILLYGGGGASAPQTGGAGGQAVLNPHTAALTMHRFSPQNTTRTDPIAASYLTGVAFTGITGGHGDSANTGWGAGAASFFGKGGDSKPASPTVNTNGANATGYGAGGAGALWVSGGAVTAGAGSPGILILEFVEGF